MTQLTTPTGEPDPSDPTPNERPPQPATAHADDTARHARATLAIASLAVLATFLDTTVLFVAFGDIARSFDTVSPAQLSWVLNAYTVVVAALLVPAGKVADRVGHKRVFLAGSILFTVASVACAAAPTAAVLVAFRVVQAAGAAALIPSSFALVLRAFPKERLPVAIAIWGASGAIAGALGPTLGAALIELSGWRLVFLINIPVGLVTVGLGTRVLRESLDPTARIPAPFGVAAIAAAGALVSLGVVQSDTWGWTDTGTLAAIGAGLVTLAAFIAHQRRTAAPVLDLDMFASGNFRWANAATLAFGLAFAAMFFGSILFLTDVWGWSTLKAGLGVSPGPLLVAVLAPRFGRLAARVGQRPLLLAGGVVFALGGLWRVLMLDAGTDYLVDYLPSILFTGTGVALCFPQLSSAVGQSLAPNRAGVGGAASQAVRQFGGTLGVALTIALLGQPATLADALGRFDRVWWLLVAGGLLTALLSLPLRTRPAPVEVPA
ncbi:DHA2 family efflux MFS transporter permease subunit [Actinomarinicola tropica]|uniref:DHA2 family efflux MFS transporter permease subunit n=1 Tax=Actinomarinicola tropica TaxID=2789776 RepID=A0A5Q2RF84_9ACTN|nr:DHA2 family efflux MFS transporter permease subunit [Actinomarinicola tropica]QGG94343.1 DHA2 family efflux MFS transporter permease subunit [Actinomarinicola tropica]